MIIEQLDFQALKDGLVKSTNRKESLDPALAL